MNKGTLLEGLETPGGVHVVMDGGRCEERGLAWQKRLKVRLGKCTGAKLQSREANPSSPLEADSSEQRRNGPGQKVH